MNTLIATLLLASVAVAVPMGGYGGESAGSAFGGFGGPAPAQASAGGYGAAASSGGSSLGGQQQQQKIAQPIVSRQIFVYEAPAQQVERGPAPVMPAQKIDYNIVFVKTPAHQAGSDAVVAPAPQQKTMVYVLSKKAGAQSTRVLEAPSSPAEKPEVFYVNYDNEHDNQQLPGGIDLQSALSASAEPMQVIRSQSPAAPQMNGGMGGGFSDSRGSAGQSGQY